MVTEEAVVPSQKYVSLFGLSAAERNELRAQEHDIMIQTLTLNGSPKMPETPRN
jgi:hypothetical protein